MSRTMRRRSILVSLLVIIPLFILLLLVSLTLEKKPLIVETKVPTVDSAIRAKNLARSVLNALNSQQESARIIAAEDDLNALMTLVGRGDKRFAGRFVVSPRLMFLNATVRLPENPLGRYLNLHGELLPDPRGLNINRIKIGKLAFPRPLGGTFLKVVLNLGLGNSEASALLESVRSVTVSGKTVTVDLREVPQLKARLKRLQTKLSALMDLGQDEPPWDRSVVAIYYRRLLETGRNYREDRPPSLFDYLGPPFTLARDRSISGDPVRENETAILALSVFLGHPLFDKLAGLEMDSGLLGRSFHHRTVLLRGRNDLRRHFIISAGLKILTDQGISTAVGEFKELLDAGRGGSGFSFIDLAADRAGIRFAETATDPNGGARRIQRMFAGNPSEIQFFPDVADFPENIPQSEFERLYGGVNDPRYEKMVREIDRRIDACPAYGGRLRH